MAIVDLWHADNPEERKFLTLSLEELTQFEVEARIEAREWNLIRLDEAKRCMDIRHLDIPYTCCYDHEQCQAIHDLLACDDREWISFTLQGITDLTNHYSQPTSLKTLSSLLLALKSMKIVNLYSCTNHRGHGLEDILKLIPMFTNMKELRLQSWQMDGISARSLIRSLQGLESKVLKLLSFKSCSFMGEDTFQEILDCLGSIEELNTLNLSYCNLQDEDITLVVEKFKNHGSLERLHIGGNKCTSIDSLEAIANWIGDESCQLKDLNLRALWVGFSEEGLLQRFVELPDLFQNIGINQSLQSITLSENYLDSRDIKDLCSEIEKKADLLYLDIGDNPFDERGAIFLLEFLRERSSIESIRFENHFVRYKCAGDIKLSARFNYMKRMFLAKASNMPLPLWAHAFARVQDDCYSPHDPTDYSADVIFRVLHFSTGKFGLPLSFRIVTHHN